MCRKSQFFNKYRMSVKDLNTILRDNDKSMDKSEDDNSLGEELGNMAVDRDAPTGPPQRPQLGKVPLLHLASSKYIDMDHYTYVYGQGTFIRKEFNEVDQLDICTFQNLHSTV